jgi:D-lactate dehydrogenase
MKDAMNKAMTIAFFDAKPYDVKSFDTVNARYGFPIKYLEPRLNAETAALARGARIVCAFVNDTMDATVTHILKEQGIELIAMRCAGYNNVELKAVFKKIRVVRVPAYSPEAVAEHAAALMLTLNRKTHRAYYRTRDHNFSIVGMTGFNMHGKTVGIIGAGKIGKALGRIMRGFGMEMLCYDTQVDEAFAAETGTEYTSLEDLYARSDIVSLHAPLMKATHHMIDSAAFAQMRDGVMLINTSRGRLVNTHDLIDALKTGKVGSAGLDVYEEESEYFFEDFSNEIIGDDMLARLLSFPNVLVTSHQGFLTHEALASIATTTLDNVRDFLDGKYLENEICYHCGKGDCEKARREGCEELKKKG